MASKDCRSCGRCRWRTTSQVVAVCEDRLESGADVVYVPLDHLCGRWVPRKDATCREWTDEERRQLVLAAQGMARSTGHSARECVDELVRIVCAYAAGEAA